MWIGQPLDIAVQRNTITPLGFSLYDLDGNVIELAEYTISCLVAEAEGEPLITTIDATEFEPNMGRFNLIFDGANFNEVSGDTEEVRLVHNILATDSAGDAVVIRRGAIILTPGV